MKKPFPRDCIIVLVALAIFCICLVGIIFLERQESNVAPLPKRAETTQSALPSPKPVGEASPDKGAPKSEDENEANIKVEEVIIEHSDILSVKIPAVDIDVKVSGETLPRKTKSCKGDEYCIDPPVPDQAAWYGKTPSEPSKNPVLIFGHTSWTHKSYATFNNLMAVKADDLITVTTETGEFTYKAENPVLVKYKDAPSSEEIYGWVPKKLVLVTCNNEKDSATVIIAYLVEATPL